MANSKREGEERGVWSWGDGYFSGEWSIFIGCLSHLVDMNSHRLSKQGEICEKIVIKSTPKFSQIRKVKNMK